MSAKTRIALNLKTAAEEAIDEDFVSRFLYKSNPLLILPSIVNIDSI
jgi:hypothetical protein